MVVDVGELFVVNEVLVGFVLYLCKICECLFDFFEYGFECVLFDVWIVVKGGECLVLMFEFFY